MAKSKKVVSKKVTQAGAPVEVGPAPMPVAAAEAPAPAPVPTPTLLVSFLWFHHELLLGRCPSSELEAVGDIPKVAGLDLLLYFPYDLFRDLNRLHQGTFCK